MESLESYFSELSEYSRITIFLISEKVKYVSHITNFADLDHIVTNLYYNINTKCSYIFTCICNVYCI